MLLYRTERFKKDFRRLRGDVQEQVGKALEKFAKVRHRVKQWSLEDAFSEEEIKEWEARIIRVAPQALFDYVGELKIDGLVDRPG